MKMMICGRGMKRLDEVIVTYEELEEQNADLSKINQRLLFELNQERKFTQDEMLRADNLEKELAYYQSIVLDFRDVMLTMTPAFHELVELSYLANLTPEEHDAAET